MPGESRLSEAVARYLFKLMAYKDEYEVARLHLKTDIARALEAEFPGGVQLCTTTCTRRSSAPSA